MKHLWRLLNAFVSHLHPRVQLPACTRGFWIIQCIYHTSALAGAAPGAPPPCCYASSQPSDNCCQPAGELAIQGLQLRVEWSLSLASAPQCCLL